MARKRPAFEVIRFQNGKLTDTEYWLIDTVDNISAARFELIERYYAMRNRIPARIAVDGEIEDEALLLQFLESKRGKKQSLFIRKKVSIFLSLKCVCRMQMSILHKVRADSAGNLLPLKSLQKLLGLSKPPEYIESYDISHTFGADNVAGMVVFHNGRPMKSAYKRFSIKGFDGRTMSAQ